MSYYGVGIGTSAPRRLNFISRALTRLQNHSFIDLIAVGDRVQGPGVGTNAGAWYQNSAALIESPLFPDDLMRALLAIEQLLGRVRTTQNAARTLDLDLLLSSLGTYQSHRVTLPHPRFHSRDFAKIPMRQAILKAEGLSSRQRAALIVQCDYSSKENFCIR